MNVAKKFKNAFWFVEKLCKSEIWTLELILVMHFKYYKKLLHTLPLIQVWPFRQLFCPWLVDLASSLEDLSVFSHFLSLRHQCAWNERIAPSVWAKIQICCPCQLPTNKQTKIMSNCSKRQRCISSISRFLCHSCSYLSKLFFALNKIYVQFLHRILLCCHSAPHFCLLVEISVKLMAQQQAKMLN